MKILDVIPLQKGVLKGDLTYFTSLDIPAGNVVSVPLRNKKVLALVVASADAEEAKADVKVMNFNLRKVAEDLGPSIFTREFLGTAFELSRYFATHRNLALGAVIPAVILEKYGSIAALPGIARQNADDQARTALPEKLVFQYPFADRASIYRTLIREAFARKESVFMVLPTEHDIAAWHKELARGIEQFTFEFHGGLSAKKVLASCERIFASSHPMLILGTASFLSLPFRNVRTVILEHESSGAYRTMRRPHMDLRAFAEAFAHRAGAKFIIADELLRFETIGRAEHEHIHPLYPLSYRINFGGETIILGKEKKWNGAWQLFTEKSVEEISGALAAKKNIFVFALRKGLATETLCRDCGETLHCEDCAAPLVLYTTLGGKKRMFVCNRCQRDWGADRLCPRCRSWNLVPLGIGTDTVCEELKKTFPKAKIFKLDKESAKSEREAKRIVAEFEKEKGAILVGTEMAFYYVKQDVPYGIIASFDSLWSIPNYKMSEKILQIILGMARITGGKMILETKNPRDSAILAVQSGNLLQFIRNELEDRKALGYPPFARFIKIVHLGDKQETKLAKEFLAEAFSEYNPHVFTGFIARLKGKYVTNALIRLPSPSWSLKELSNGSIDGDLLQKLLNLPPDYEVHVDPEDLL